MFFYPALYVALALMWSKCFIARSKDYLQTKIYLMIMNHLKTIVFLFIREKTQKRWTRWLSALKMVSWTSSLSRFDINIVFSLIKSTLGLLFPNQPHTERCCCIMLYNDRRWTRHVQAIKQIHRRTESALNFAVAFYSSINTDFFF